MNLPQKVQNKTVYLFDQKYRCLKILHYLVYKQLYNHKILTIKIDIVYR